MNRLYLPARIALLSLPFCCGALGQSQGRTATVHLRIVNVYNAEDLGAATVTAFEREYGDVRSGNFAVRFRRNIASDIPYDFYKLCAHSTGFWTGCTEVPVYQPEVWVVLGLRFGIAGLAGLSELAGTVTNAGSAESAVRVRLIGVYSGITTDAELDSSGHFLMSGIPPGKCVLVTIQGNRIVDTRPIEMPTGGPVEIDLQSRK